MRVVKPWHRMEHPSLEVLGAQLGTALSNLIYLAPL